MCAEKESSKQKVVLITGASSGFGRETATLLAKSGYRVFGTSRNPERNRAWGYEMIPLDVRSDNSVRACVQGLMERTGRLDVLVSNAGYELAGAVEETSIDEARDQFETNFFGTVRLVKTALPMMRKQGGGRIVLVSSLAGLIAIPFHGFYSASKYALEGYAEALRHEVKGFNISVSLVEPGFFRTNLASSARSSADVIDVYSGMRGRARRMFEEFVQAGDDPGIVATVILSIIESRSPRLRYRVGKDAKRLPRIKAIVPQDAFEAGVRRNFHLDR
ncbi:MAG: SDR family NAD(P)-dependent oxidoreductase [Nitrospirae bacterium]|nr:SDR family NAD(P)-dependent oxidoreductase [Nitrospirota bacterium]NTW65962.1 SDR family NAD(P)-dependent oxidoreductase [Nitrospirota bacterium]